MDYQAVRKKYTLYTRVAGIMTMLLILCVSFAVSDIPMRTGGVLVIVAGLALAIYVINKWYLTTVAKLLHVDLDLASWKQYIEANKEAKRAALRLDAATSEVSLAYMTGDFETAIRKAKEILSRDGLQVQYRDFLQSYLIRSVVLSQPELSREELDTMIGELTITDPTLAEKTQKMSVALYDLTNAHESNDYFETLTNEYKYPQLEIIYYKALNAAIKGETNRANELLSQLDSEDERLYVVRIRKGILDMEEKQMKHEGEIFAFIFDGGATGSDFYGQVIFENMICGKELVNNPYKMIVSLGDVFIDNHMFGLDIEPYVHKDEYCTIDFKRIRQNPFKDYPFVWVVEDIIPEIAESIDGRLRKNFSAYMGMFKINRNSTDEKKQFWKKLIRSFAINKNEIITFINEEGAGHFYNESELNKYGYIQLKHKAYSFSTLDEETFRQSNLVKTEKDLEIVLTNAKEIDRDLTPLNFSIREELQIAGTLIWKSIHSLDKISFENGEFQPYNLVEYPFMTLYFASQGIERIQKSLIELICKDKHIQDSDKSKVYELLMSHSHNGLNDWIENNSNIKLKKSGKKLLTILSDFYNTIRYARYKDETYSKSKTPELDLLRMLTDTEEVSSEVIKTKFGKYLWAIANQYNEECSRICHELNIYAYELDYQSSATFVYSQTGPKNLYERYEIIHQYKKEVIYWIMKNGKEYPKCKYCNLDTVEFDPELVDEYLKEIIYYPEDIYTYYDAADDFYDELYSQSKTDWNYRNYLMDNLFND